MKVIINERTRGRVQGGEQMNGSGTRGRGRTRKQGMRRRGGGDEQKTDEVTKGQEDDRLSGPDTRGA